MKTNALYFILSLFIIVSCSSSDDDGNTPNEPIIGNYYPSVANNTWIYNVENLSIDDATLNSTGVDLVEINTSGNPFTIEVNSGNSSANGLMNAILNSGTLNRSGSTLGINGTINLPEQLEIISNSSLNLSNFVLYDLNANINQQLSEINDVLTDEININGSIIPINAIYSITSTRRNNLNSLDVDGETFNDIISTEINVNITITATIDIAGSSTTVTVVNAQDVLNITSFFAEDIGLIQSEATQSYTLDPAFLNLLQVVNITLDFPTSLSVDNTQELDSFQVN
ncbi:hypothetical protein [Winogradskyella immobilis]|uniref:Lipoprotein n=1 Tax=Winogradskyella immobilis TaxID=2816852 RepID=A0ABS8EQ49_9FLAO|nr:hypothetical protein [Winogradskyella immobilis]MCC1485117.1 hypothetical protein [Winogradskyella immobilis]MCG0017209.1 hypothetical protein [Winogradskyella immobilis]